MEALTNFFGSVDYKTFVLAVIVSVAVIMVLGARRA